MLAVWLGLALTAQTPKVTVAAVGDVMLARWVGRRIDRQGAARVLQDVRPALKGADIVYGNLECALTRVPATVRKPIVLRANPSTVTALKGFNVLSLVNNHAGDSGPAGLSEAQDTLRRANVIPLGPNLKPEFKTVNGVRIGFLGLMNLPGYSLSEGWEDAVVRARSACDVLIIGIHWGVEGSPTSSHDQRVLAQRLATLGVDAILGCHPHVLEPIVALSGSNGRRCLVAYSLGNFVFDAKKGADSKTEILFLQLTKAGVSDYWTQNCVIRDGFPALVAGVNRGRLLGFGK